MRIELVWAIVIVALVVIVGLLGRNPEAESVVSAASVKQMCEAPDSEVTVTIVKGTWTASTTLTCKTTFGDSERTGMEDDRG